MFVICYNRIYVPSVPSLLLVIQHLIPIPFPRLKHEVNHCNPTFSREQQRTKELDEGSELLTFTNTSWCWIPSLAFIGRPLSLLLSLREWVSRTCVKRNVVRGRDWRWWWWVWLHDLSVTPHVLLTIISLLVTPNPTNPPTSFSASHAIDWICVETN